jgi:hypothetical protein
MAAHCLQKTLYIWQEDFAALHRRAIHFIDEKFAAPFAIVSSPPPQMKNRIRMERG